MNDHLHSFIEPELEARIVALVLGEASAFEAGALEKLIAEQPELQAFKVRVAGVHGVVDLAHREVNAEEWQLSDERREVILSHYRKAAQTEVVEKRRERGAKRSQRNLIYACAACLIVTLILGGMLAPMGVKSSALESQSAAPVAEFVSREAALADLDAQIMAQSDRVQDHRKDLTVLIQQYGIPYFDGKQSSPLGATEQDMFRGARQRLATLQTNRDSMEEKLQEGIKEGMPSEEKQALASELKSTNGLIDKVEEMVDSRKSDTVDLSLRQHTYTQAKESYEQSREMLREMKLARVHAGVGMERNANPEPAVDKAAISDALASLNEAIPMAGDSKSDLGVGSDSTAAFPVTPAKPTAFLTDQFTESESSGPASARVNRPIEGMSWDQEFSNSEVAQEGKAMDLPAVGRLFATRGEGANSRSKRQTVSGRKSEEQKPATRGASLSKVIAANSTGPTSIPVPASEMPSPALDFGDGDEFGDGWEGNGRDRGSYAFWVAPENGKLKKEGTGSSDDVRSIDRPELADGGVVGEWGSLQQQEQIKRKPSVLETAAAPVTRGSTGLVIGGAVPKNRDALIVDGKDRVATPRVPSSADSDDPFASKNTADLQPRKGESFDFNAIESIPLYSASARKASEGKVGATVKKLNETILPELKLENATLEEALAIIKEKMGESQPATLDPFEEDFGFKVRSPRTLNADGSVEVDEDRFGSEVDASQTRIKELDLKNVPARIALQYVADAAKVRYKIERDGGVTLLPIGEGADSDIVQRRWEVPANFETFITSSDSPTGAADDDPFATGLESGEIKPRRDITTLLKMNGVSFPPNASASFISGTNTLIIRNTPTNLELMDGIISAAVNEDDRKAAEEERAKKEVEARKRLRTNFETLTSQKSDSTFSLNVSDVSFKLAEAALREGRWPDASKVRPEEFVNALDYGDTKPSQAEKVACAIEQGAHPFMPQRNLMRVAMSTASLGRNATTPLRLTLLLDQSGSMERADRAESVKRAFALLAAQLTANDEITLIGFARTPRLLAERVKGDEAAKLAQIIANPLTEGGTNLEAALASGLQLAKQQFLAGAQNRIILLTDGAANLGDALPGNLAKHVAAMRQSNIAFDACGVGADGLNDEVLSALTKQGDGRYYFLDRPEDADAGFAKQIAGALRPSAKNVKVQILFNPERVSKFKLYGFEKHKLKKEDFRNDAVDAAEMAAEESGVALYHFEPLPEGRGDIGTVSVRFLDTASGQMVERTWGIPYEPEVSLFPEANPNLRLASVAGLFAEKLKGSIIGERVDLARLRQEAEALKSTFDHQPRFQSLKTMLQEAGQ